MLINPVNLAVDKDKGPYVKSRTIVELCDELHAMAPNAHNTELKD